MDRKAVAAGAWMQLGRAEGQVAAARHLAAAARSVLSSYDPPILEALRTLPEEQGWSLAQALAPWREALEQVAARADAVANEHRALADRLRVPARAALLGLDGRGLPARARAALRGAVAGWRGSGPGR